MPFKWDFDWKMCLLSLHQFLSFPITDENLILVYDLVTHFHNYLYGVPFIVQSEHGSLRVLINLEGQLERCSELLRNNNITLDYRRLIDPVNKCKHCD